MIANVISRIRGRGCGRSRVNGRSKNPQQNRQSKNKSSHPDKKDDTSNQNHRCFSDNEHDDDHPYTKIINFSKNSKKIKVTKTTTQEATLNKGIFKNK